MGVIGSAVTRIAARPHTCVLDARLMLEPLGQVLACRLARQAETWFVRRFWSLLDNDSYFQRFPQELARACTHDHARQLARWRTAWLEGLLNQRFYWVGDARYESMLPPEVDQAIRDRLDRLTAALDPPADEASAPHLGVLDHCARDALALAAALADGNPIIFTAANGAGPPALVELARRFGVFQIVKPTREDIDLIPRNLRDIVAPLVPFGMRIVAVHVIAPAAALMPEQSGDAAEWEPAAGDEAAHWSEACLTWQPV